MKGQVTQFDVLEGTDKQAQLGFYANSCVIDNLTASWLYNSDSGKFIPPFTYGCVLPLPGTQIANLQWRVPANLITPTAGVGICHCVFSTESAIFNPGTVVVQAQPMGGATPVLSSVPLVSNFTGISLGLAAGATAPLVAGAAGKVIVLYGFWWNFSVHSGEATGFYAGQIEDTTGAILLDALIVVAAATLTNPHAERAMPIPGGWKLPAGSGLNLVNSPASVGKIDIAGSVAYTLS